MIANVSPAGLARRCAGRPWPVVAIWLVVAVIAAGIAGARLDHVLSPDVVPLSRPESVRGTDLLKQAFPAANRGSETVLVHSATATVDQPVFAAKLQETSQAVLQIKGLVVSAPTYQQAKAAGSPLAEQMVSADRHTAIIPVTFIPDNQQKSGSFDTYMNTITAQSGGGFQVYTVGNASVNRQFTEVAKSDLTREIYGLPVALIVLVIVFGALVAASVPIVLGIVSIIIALGLATIVGEFSPLSTYAENMITVIGLAVGIDYALFIIERYREERRRGAGKREAIAITGGSASKAVLFSGMTVVIALCGLLFIPTTVFHGLGIGAILVVVVAVLAMLTLVPALLSLIGDHLEWPRRRRTAPCPPNPLSPEFGGCPSPVSGEVGRGQSLRSSGEGATHTGFWSRMAKTVTRRPAIGVVLAVVLLAVLAIPYFGIKTGTESVESLPPTEAKSAAQLLSANFPAGLSAPVKIVVSGQRSPAVESAIQRLTTALAKDPTYGPLLGMEWSPTNQVAEITLPLAIDPNSPEAYTAIRHLRQSQIPAAFEGTTAEVLVTGTTATDEDVTQLINDWTPIVFVFVLGMSFILLLLAFRSVVISATAIVVNLLSVGAAYGCMVFVFQNGYLHNVFGFQKTPIIVDWIPIFLFCVLFGLSMDYHVFLLSRIREHYDQTHRNAESVTSGLQATGKIITGAAMIMVVVFAAFATGKMVMFQQVGFGLAVAIFLDATVVRCILVPAVMALLGDWNWYLPKWLQWLPDLRVEGAAEPPLVVPAGAETAAASPSES